MSERNIVSDSSKQQSDVHNNDGAQNLFESAYDFGKQIVNDFKTQGPLMATALTDRIQHNPQETAIEAAAIVAVGGLAVAAVTTESPILLGAAGAAAIAGGLGIAGYEAKREIERRTEDHK